MIDRAAYIPWKGIRYHMKSAAQVIIEATETQEEAAQSESRAVAKEAYDLADAKIQEFMDAPINPEYNNMHGVMEIAFRLRGALGRALRQFPDEKAKLAGMRTLVNKMIDDAEKVLDEM